MHTPLPKPMRTLMPRRQDGQQKDGQQKDGQQKDGQQKDGQQSCGQKPGCAECGFTLAELLVVIAVVLLLVLIAIPNFSGMKIQANETAAIESLRSVYQAEVEYQASYPASGFACSLQTLGGSVSSGKPTPQSAHMLPADLARGEKSGYLFRIVHCVGGPITQGAQYTGFEAIAVPRQLGKTGHRGFCVDRRGELKFDPAGGTDCTESVQ